jgi:hypothetical protein
MNLMVMEFWNNIKSFAVGAADKAIQGLGLA